MPPDLAVTATAELGLPGLHPVQRRAAEAAIGGRDVLVVAPTGFGKSAIYELAGLRRAGPTVVVSPLLALQADQVDGLRARDLDAVALNSTVANGEREAALESIAAGDMEFVLLAPEQLARAALRERLAAAGVSLVVVDEAHCVSEWGHDFRPDYVMLGPAIEQLGRPPVLALTATATASTRDDIVSRLGMRDPLVLVEGFDRPNIALAVERVSDDAAKAARIGALVGRSSPALVYVARRRSAEELVATLQEAGIEAAAYHAGLPAAERADVQDRFLGGTLPVIVATNAFGMGIDKPDVRLVVHHDVPGSLEAYYQEVGRAGRDGEPADAVLLYRPEDLGVRRYFAAGGRLGIDALEQVLDAVDDAGGVIDRDELEGAVELGRNRLTAALGRLRAVGAVELRDGGDVVALATSSRGRRGEAAARAEQAHERLERSRVEMVRAYAEARQCRRRALLAYFGDELGEDCGHCDRCAGSSAVDTAREVERPWEVGAVVEHGEWGRGAVVGYERDLVTVQFDDHGYKTMQIDHVLDEELLAPSAAD